MRRSGAYTLAGTLLTGDALVFALGVRVGYRIPRETPTEDLWHHAMNDHLVSGWKSSVGMPPREQRFNSGIKIEYEWKDGIGENEGYERLVGVRVSSPDGRTVECDKPVCIEEAMAQIRYMWEWHSDDRRQRPGAPYGISSNR